MTTTPTSGAAIQRYKIGYHSDEWGQRSSTPSGIPDASGSWVRYADHVTALAAGQATAAQQGAYAALSESFLEIPDVQDESGINAYYSREVVLECIDAALASRGQAPASVLHLVNSAFAEIAMVFPKAFALHKVGIADTAVLEALAAPATAQADSVTEPAGVEEGDIDAVALARYKVVPAHESMTHRFAVVAGDGNQQLYLGREVECENMARKFAGAFLDGAFYQANITPSTQAAGSVPAVEREQERIAFKDAHRHLDLDEVPDAWGQPMFKHSHVEASWLGWIARASHGQAPAGTTVYPMACDEDESDLGAWQDGATKPTIDGIYLRDFDECQGTSEFYEGKWLRDGFFPSDIQDARWRGRNAPQPSPTAQADNRKKDPL